jgi:tetratricopeptide (TPR) repeat protein
MIRGIESEEADTNGDGKITCLELNDYLKNKMRELGHPQTPQIKIEKDDVTLAFTKKKGKDHPSTVQANVDSSKEVEYLLKVAHAKEREFKYDLAMEAYEQILRIDPHNANALFGKAQSLSIEHKYEESLKFYEETLVVTNENPTVLFQKGIVFRNLGRHKEAYRIFENFTFDSKLSPTFPRFLDRLIDRGNDTLQAAKLQYRELDAILYHPKKALSYWQDQLKSTVDVSDLDRKQKRTAKIAPLNNVSYLLHRLGRDQEALRYLKLVLHDYPDDVYALTTAKSILQDAQLQLLHLDILMKDDGNSIQQREDKKYLIKEINQITKT